ncbi:MAG: bifunctional DNA primase/polymerase [Minisyncoccia bacterium]
MNDEKLKTKLDWALYYQNLGLSIIPVGLNKKSLVDWKIYEDRSPNVDEINTWWEQWPWANPALITGKVSGVVALDLDIKHNRTSKEFQIPPTVSARSGSGGEHFFFKYPSGVYVKSGSAISGEGVDSRAEKGYILLAPSINENGGKYEWIIPLESKEDLAEMPEWFKKLTTENTSDRKWLNAKDGVSEGSRNDTAASRAGKILSSTDPKLWEDVGWEQLKVWNEKDTPPLSEKELRGVWESIKRIHENDIQDGSKGSQASILLESILSRKDVSLFHDEQGRGYISMAIDGHQEIWSCGGRKIKLWLSSEIHRTQEKAPTAEVKKSILSVLEGKACFEGSEIKLHDRVAWHGDEIFYDLTNSKWQIVKIAKEGWEIVDNPPTIFKRYPHHKEQVTPVKNGNVKLFLDYINVANPEHQLLLLIFLISCFIPDFPHVMLVVFGAQGSSKSTLSKLARLVVDPSLIDVASFPHSQRELIQALAHHYFLFFDNVSHITEEESDTLCKAITGGGHVKRELYENDEDIIYTFMRCIGMNGINLVTTRPDLLERSLLLELERIDPADRKTEKELYQNFAKDLPSILGGIFDVLVKAIQIQPTIKLDSHHRMADWSLWGCAITEALGYSKDEFLKAYQNNITRQSEMLLNENIVAITLFSFVEEKKEWEGTATELLQELYKRTPLDYFEKQEKYWPRSAASLMRKINELRTYLRQIGISVTTKMLGFERRIYLEKIKEKEPKQLALTDDNYDIDEIIPESKELISAKDLPF